MKSPLFTDTQDFDGIYACPPEMICICLRLDRSFYLGLCRRAAAEGMTTGQYMQHAVEAWESLVLGAQNPNPPGFLPAGREN